MSLTNKEIQLKTDYIFPVENILSNLSELANNRSVNDSHYSNDSKRLHGQFFTTTNPFVNEAFTRWFNKIPLNDDGTRPEILEPFAGSNNIVWMVRDLSYKNSWKSFDIDVVDHDDNSCDDVVITARNTILDYPKGYSVAITNPPYLAKNSATRRGLAYAGGEYDDVYKKCLAVMLKHTDYVAAIVPESFITQNLFHDRLSAVVSLTCRMFQDTETPVCLALFVPPSPEFLVDDFEIWSGNRKIGQYRELQRHFKKPARSLPWDFNNPNGFIGLSAIDNAKKDSISFMPGDEISPLDVKSTSRSITRIHLHGLTNTQASKIIDEANLILRKKRSDTKDIFMTAFKGLREDGKYRRRLDYAQARDILNTAFCNLNMSLPHE